MHVAHANYNNVALLLNLIGFDPILNQTNFKSNNKY